MDNIMMLNFLMENDVIIKHPQTGNCMTADEAFLLGGEFVVYDYREKDLYRGTNFSDAMLALEGKG